MYMKTKNICKYYYVMIIVNAHEQSNYDTNIPEVLRPCGVIIVAIVNLI